MNRVNPEKQRGGYSSPVAGSKLLEQDKDQQSCGDVEHDVQEMPAARVESEQGMSQDRPNDEERAIEGADRRNLKPEAAAKRPGSHLPGQHQRVGDHLHLVVPHKLIAER